MDSSSLTIPCYWLSSRNELSPLPFKSNSVCSVHLTLVTVQVGLYFLFASEESQHYSSYFVVESHMKLGCFGPLTNT